MPRATENELNKLRYIPKFELVNLLLRKYSGRNAQLSALILTLESVNSRKPRTRIKTYSQEKLIELYGLVDQFPSGDIEELFKEYLYTNQPTLFFCYISSIDSENLYQKTQEQMKDLINPEIVSLNELTAEQRNPKIKNLRLIELEKSSGIIEIDLEFERRIDYINPDDKKVSQVYTLESGNLWISITNKAIIIKVSDANIIRTITSILETFLDAKIGKYNIPKEVGDALFGFDSIKKADYEEVEPDSPDYDERKTVSDKNFCNKRESKELNDRCDRKSALHSIDIMEKNTSIAVSDNGRIKVYNHIKKSQLRGWAFEIIEKINTIISHLRPEDFRALAQSKDISLCKSLDVVSSKKGKEIFKEIYISLKKIIDDNTNSIPLRNSIKEVYLGLKDLFIPLFQPVCTSCGGIHYMHSCGAVGSIYVDKFLRPKCLGCNQEITDLATEVKCTSDDTHTIDENLFENIVLMGTSLFNKTLNEFSDEIDIEFKLSSMDVVRIQNKTLSYRKLSVKLAYDFNEINNFDSLTSLQDIPQEFKTNQLNNIGASTEKCTNHSQSNCRNCIVDQKGLCVQRLVSEFVETPQLHAHHGHEYGDMKLNVTIDIGSVSFIGVAKACKNSPDVNFTLKNNEGLKLLTQCLELFTDARIRGVCVISSAFLDERLTESLIALSRFYGKKIFFIKRDEIIRMLYDYLKNKEEITTLNYWQEK